MTNNGRDKLFINGIIFTSDESNPICDSMIVSGNEVKWTGKKADITYSIDEYESYDLEGKCVLPGFIDAHMHTVMLSDLCNQVTCMPPEICSIKDLVEALCEKEKENGVGNWIEGWGYDESKFTERRQPNRYDIDSKVKDSPVFLLRTCAHIACVNTKALELAGITRDTPNPPGGEIEKDSNGEPTGILKENAKNLVFNVMKKKTEDNVAEDIVQLGKILSSYGITSVTDMGDLNGTDDYDVLIKAKELGLQQDVALYYMWDHFCNKNFSIPAERMSGDNQIRVAGLKLIADGSISGRTAWVEEHYLGDINDHGISTCSPDLLDDAIEECKKTGAQLAVHAMGGRAIEQIVNRVYDEAHWTEPDIPFVRLEHITEPKCESIVKCREKNIALVMQPIFLYAEIENYIKYLGPERTKKTYPIKTLLNENITVAMSTDAPATAWAVPYDPFVNIKAAVTRVAYDNTDCGLEECIDVATAIKMYTREGAKVAGIKRRGVIKNGYYADFIVIDKNPFEISPNELDEISVEKTYKNGKLVYSK